MTPHDPDEEQAATGPNAPQDAPPADSDGKIADGAKNPESAGYEGSEMQTEATRLMTAVQAGDVDAFDTLVVRLRGRSFQVARALVGSRDDAM